MRPARVVIRQRVLPVGFAIGGTASAGIAANLGGRRNGETIAFHFSIQLRLIIPRPLAQAGEFIPRKTAGQVAADPVAGFKRLFGFD